MKPPPVKRKKKVLTLASQNTSFAERLVYLTGIPEDSTEQEVTDLVRSFGKINNVILMPSSEEESKKGEGQKVLIRCTHCLFYKKCNFTFLFSSAGSQRENSRFCVCVSETCTLSFRCRHLFA